MFIKIGNRKNIEEFVADKIESEVNKFLKNKKNVVIGLVGGNSVEGI